MFILEEQKKNLIVKRFGSSFTNMVEYKVNYAINTWKISELDLIDSYSSNLVFRGYSSIYGAVVIKLCVNENEFENEVNALKLFNNDFFCSLFDFDHENLLLLEEKITPGNQLFENKDIKIQLEVFIDLYNKIHKNKYNNTYKNDVSYKNWIFDICDYMANLEEWKELSIHMQRAKMLFIKILDDYPQDTVIHGDLHYYNILKSEVSYKLIDPKGVIGNRIFDIPRFVLNIYIDSGNNISILDHVIHKLSKQLQLSDKLLMQLLYIESSMAICWMVQDGMSIDNKLELLENLNILYRHYSKFF